MVHIPVLQKEVLEYLDPKPNENFIDCTIGEGGHSAAVLEKNCPKGKVLGIELDPVLFEKLRAAKLKNKNEKIKNRLILVNDSYTNLEKIVKEHKFEPVSGILFDLGMSSWHLEESKKGFSFLRNEHLDMRYNPKTNFLSAEKIINFWSQPNIEKILKEYGEERYAKNISRKIIEARRIRPIKTTSQLIKVIQTAVPKRYQWSKLHFATKTFQALRIAVNDELNNLEIVLPQALKILSPGGRLVVISFHSLEDRIVKNFFSAYAKGYDGQENQTKPPHLSGTSFAKFRCRKHPVPDRCGGKEGLPILKILTKKPARPIVEEIKINSRSRSAKLRAAIKRL